MKSACGAALAMMVLAVSLAAGDNDQTSWQKLNRLTPGQQVEVNRRNGESLKGSFVSFSDDSISVRESQQDIVIPRNDVSRVRLRSRGRHKALWIGLAAGAGGGAAVGAGVAASVSNQSGGDFASLKPAVIGVCTGIGAVAGLAIGSILDSRHDTIYRAK
jgi:hypothetical protein